MTRPYERWRAARLLATLGLALLTGRVQADPDEAWLHRAPLPAGLQPLLVLLVDSSAAMAGLAEVPPPYDPGRDYAAGVPGTACRADRLYWQRGPGPAPDCTGGSWVSRDGPVATRGWRCHSGRHALDTVGYFVAARAAQWEPRAAGGGYWRELRADDDGAVECRADRGLHGDTSGAGFAADGADDPWASDAAREPWWDSPPLADAYAFYTGNYLNYLATTERTATTRYGWLVARILSLAQAAVGLDLALARFSHDGLGGDDDGRGGMIALGPLSLPSTASTLSETLSSWSPAGPAPLGEALAEVARWMAGLPVDFGRQSQSRPGQPLPSAPSVRRPDQPDLYRSPFSHACRAVTLAATSAGTVSADAGASAAARQLPGFDAAPADCTGSCLAPLAAYLAGADAATTWPGRQAPQLRFLLPSGQAVPAGLAAWSQGDLDSPLALVQLALRALQHDAAVGSPQRLSAAGLEAAPFPAADTAVYFGLSQASGTSRWPGNLRRYTLVPPDGPLAAPGVTGRDGEPVFDPASGRLLPGSWSLWSPAADGADLQGGGAAGRLPDPPARRLYSDLAGLQLDAAENRLAEDNPLVTRALLGLGLHDPRTVVGLLDWLRGADAFDEDFDGDRSESRPRVGDPGLRAPQVLRYAAGGAGLAFVATQDGMLQAFDADSGQERWAFLPRELLPHLAARTDGYATTARPQGFDGPLALHWHDANTDGQLVAADGDRAWLYAGLGRGGTGYYALDVSEPEAPRLAWRLSADDLPGFAQSWPAPVLARMRLGSAVAGGDARVIVLAGGFDPAEDSPAGRSASRGATLALVDATTGDLLWRAAGSAAPGVDLVVPALRRSTPAAPRVIDSDSDGFDDRVYLLASGGQLLRFDFALAEDGSLQVSPRVLASLGGDATPMASRRFLATPDAVLVDRGGQRQLALAFGSGWLSRPRAAQSDDRFFVVFDALGGAPPSSPLTVTDLADVSEPPHEAPPHAAGWMLRLDTHGAGEKTAGSSVTFDHRLRFTTYQPRPQPGEAPCGPPAGISRLYTVDIRNGRPLNWVDDRPVPDDELALEGLPPALSFAFPPPGTGQCEPDCVQRPGLLIGGRSQGIGFSNQPLKTSWRQLDATAE